MSDKHWQLFEGRYFDLRLLSRIRRHGRKIYGIYSGAPVIIAEYSTIEDAKYGRSYLRRRVAR